MEGLKMEETTIKRQNIYDASAADPSFTREPNYCDVNHPGLRILKASRIARLTFVTMILVLSMSFYSMWGHFITPWFTYSGQLPMKHMNDTLLDFDDVSTTLSNSED